MQPGGSWSRFKCCVLTCAFTLPLPVTSVGRLRVAVLQNCALCVGRVGVPVEVPV